MIDPQILREGLYEMLQTPKERELVISIIAEVLKKEELWGWEEIRGELGVSTPTAILMAREQRLPVALVGKTPFSTKGWIVEWKEKQKFDRLYCKIKDQEES